MLIGLRVYKVKLYKNNSTVLLSDDGGEGDLSSTVGKVLSKYQHSPLDDGKSKTVRFTPSKPMMNRLHGVMKYGVYGFESEVENIRSGVVAHTRSVDEADTIPLYYQLWMCPGYSYALWAFQSYGGKSCVEMVRREFRDAHTARWGDIRVESEKVVPNDAALYGAKTVKRLKLVKKNAPASIIDKALRPVQSGSDLDIEFYLKPRGSGTFGRLSGLGNKLDGHLTIGGVDYDGAFAEIKVGNSYKKVGVLGVSSKAGVIDMTDDVKLDSGNHPKIKSISKVTEGHISDFARILGK